MKKLILALVLVCSMAHAAPMEVLNASGSFVPLRSDNDGKLLVSGALSAESSGGTASLSTGLMAENIRQIATNTVFALSDITSGTAAPFWITLRNIGDKTIHYSIATPTDSSDGIPSGEQVALYLGTNTPKLNLQSNSAGISTLTTNIWK